MLAAGFDHITVVQNPAASHARRGERAIERLEASEWKNNLEVVKTLSPDEHDNIELVRDRLEDGAIVWVNGGDGTNNIAFNAIMRAIDSGQVDADRIGIVPFRMGNGKDLYKSLHGRRRSPEDLLKTGEPAWLDAMKFSTSNGQERYVHSYIGVGFTGLAGYRINEPGYRDRRRKWDARIHGAGRAMDISRIVRAAFNRQPFGYHNGSGEIKKAEELLLTLMPKVAAAVIPVDTDPFDRQVVIKELGDKHFILSALAIVCLQRLQGTKGQPLAGQREMTIMGDTYMQYDGEPLWLPDGTEITFSHHPEAVQTLV